MPQYHSRPRVDAQAWALLEHDEGRIDEARRLFQLASNADPQHLYVWQVCMSSFVVRVRVRQTQGPQACSDAPESGYNLRRC